MTDQAEAKNDDVDLALAQLDQVAGGLTKVGVGTLSLAAANTYTGATTVQGGFLSL